MSDQLVMGALRSLEQERVVQINARLNPVISQVMNARGANLAVDVGAGTQDILVYDPSRTPENCFRLVMPSQTQVVAIRIGQLTLRGLPLHLAGTVMGGGASTDAVRARIDELLAHHEERLRLCLDAVESVGSNQFDATNSLAWHTGLAGDGGFGSVRSGMVELSNVDLSQEFSDLVIMQRGYQASSQVISTANDMLQELFQMKSK